MDVQTKKIRGELYFRYELYAPSILLIQNCIHCSEHIGVGIIMSAVGLAAAGPSSQNGHARQSLLQHVKEALEHSAAGRSCRGKLRLDIVSSTPRLAKDLYPFAHIDTDDYDKFKEASPVTAYVEHIIMTASYTESTESQGRLMYALECFLYTLPKHNASLLYVSKLDSSGYGPKPIPKHLQSMLIQSPSSDPNWDSSASITRVITKAFLSYFASLSHWSGNNALTINHISIHILARSQGAYLFPSSNDNKGKHILSDSGLIKWWRSVVSSVICGIRRREEGQARIQAHPFYLIPGYERLESHEVLPLPPQKATQNTSSSMPVGDQALAEAGWVYGHPYSENGRNEKGPLPSLPLSGPTFITKGNEDFDPNKIAVLLPHFPDDPKSRFISELARDSYEHAAKRKSEAKEGDESEPESKRAKKENNGHGDEEENLAKIEKPSSQGNAIITKAMRERRALDAVSPDEFWQRMGFRQECCAGNIVGVFVALFTRTNLEAEDFDAEGDRSEKREVQAQTCALPHPILPDLIMKHLMRDACDWSSEEGSRDLTKAWHEGIERAIKRKGRGSGLINGEDQSELGKDVVFTEVDLLGPSEDAIKLATMEWSRNAPDPSNQADGSPTIQVNTLSVKRKKKA